MKFKFIAKDKISQLPKNPGIYAFKKGSKLLYIGKAADLRERVKNHFLQPAYRDNLFINQVEKIGYIKTDSEIEALILEAKLIKKYQPKYNVVWRDDKNYFYIAITKEDLPRVFITHQTKLKINYIGPFVEGASLKKTLRILRKIFPYYTAKKHSKAPCPWCHLGYCPGPRPDKKEYRKNIKNLVAVLKGKRRSILKKLRKEMKFASSLRNFEKAAKIRDQVEVLEKVISHTKIFEPKPLMSNWDSIQKILKQILKTKGVISRIEAYDISNIQGRNATGSMVTFINGRPDKNFYRKFKIKIEGKPNDVAMIKETLSRRFQHPEWGWPDLILIDGGIAQLNIAIKSKLQNPNYKKIKIMALAKKKNELFIEGKKRSVLLKNLPREVFNLILQLRDEAHRFAISYHRKLRDIDLKELF